MRIQITVNLKKKAERELERLWGQIIFSFSFVLFFSPLYGQDYINISQPISINLDGRPPHHSAVLDLSGSGSGIVFPVIHSDSLLQNFDPLIIPKGMMWYASDKKCLYIKKDIANGWVTNCFHQGFSGAIIPHVESEETDYIHSVSSDNSSQLLTQDEIRAERSPMHKSLFSVSDSDSYTLPSANNSTTQIPYSNLDIVRFSAFKNNQFEAGRSGYHYFSANITFSNGDGKDDSISLEFNKNGDRTDLRILIDPRFYTDSGKEQTSSLSGILHLSAGDKVDVRVHDVDGISVKASRRTFSGFLLSY